MTNAFDAKKFSFQNPPHYSDDADTLTSGRLSMHENF
jgi:Regulator of chromosome condensation (RCC1) repeat